MVISQSGPSLVLTFPGAPEWTLLGTIRGESLTAGGQGPSPKAPDAALGNAADLELILDWQADPDRLTGVVRLSGCGAAMRFAATRQSGGSPGLH
jgi:hypothetical protein